MRTSLLASLLLAVTASLTAGPLTPTSYSIVGSPYSYVDDTGSQLTDGLLNSIVPGVSLGNDGPPSPYPSFNWVGWSNNAPTITFNFGSIVTVENILIDSVLWTQAGVYLPGQVVINSDAFEVTTNGIGSYDNFDRNVLSFDGSWTGDTLTLAIQRAPGAGEWMFVDEISFDGFVGQPNNNNNPVPDSGATIALMGLALTLLGLGRSRWFARHAS